MMKNSKILFGFAACCAMMATTSCSQDELAPENNQPIVTEETATSYVTVSLAAPKGGFNGGRAYGDNGDNFNNGYAAEGAISSVFLVFYDNSGRAVTSTPVTLGNKQDQTQGDPSVETIYTVKVQLQLPVGTAMPTQVVAYVNPINTKELLVSLSEAEQLSRARYSIPGKNEAGEDVNYFTMNNSVYYKNGTKTITAEVTAPDATKPNELKATIYVERLAAKVSVAKAAAFSTAEYQLNPTQTLQFTPEKWMLTATETTTYLLKNLPATQPIATAFPFTLNDVNNFRSYWAMSWNYEGTNFPMVGCDNDDPDMEFPLDYVSYSDVATNGITFGAVNEGNEAYCLENTGRQLKWTGAAANAYNPKAAFTSVVLVGNYTVKENGTVKTFGADGFYTYFGQIYDKAGLIEAMAGGQTYVVDAAGKPVDLDKFTVRHIHTYSRLGDTKVPASHVALQLNATETFTDLYYKAAANEDAVAITTENLNEVNAKLAEYANSLAVHYVNSKGFFYIPVEHGGLNNDEVVTGTYGVVRNHFYKMTINKIEGLAEGINSLDETLLPTTLETEKGSVDITFNIDAWHLMSQSVDL